jgi:hypothetical protein
MWQRSRLARKVNEHSLGYILRKVSITAHLSQSRRIHQVYVALNQLREGCLTAAGGVALE